MGEVADVVAANKIGKVKLGLPHHEGVFRAVQRTAERPELLIIEPSSRTSFAELAENYTFFCHTTLFALAGATRDPLHDHWVDTNGAFQPVVLVSEQPLFVGLELVDERGKIRDASWNHYVGLCPNEHWPALSLELAATVLVEPKLDELYFTVMQEFQLPDMLALAKLATLPKQLPAVTCYGLALSSTKFLAKFAPELRRRDYDPIPVVKGPPDPALKQHVETCWNALQQQRSATELATSLDNIHQALYRAAKKVTDDQKES